MKCELMLFRERCRFNDIGLRQNAAPPGVFQRETTRACVMRVAERLYRRGNGSQIQCAVGLLWYWLRLNRAEHGSTTAFEFVGMRFAADDVFIAAFAMPHQRKQIGLRAAR